MQGAGRDARKRFTGEAGLSFPVDMVYRWNDRKDEAVVVMNTPDAGQVICGWLMHALQQAIYDSGPEPAGYFFRELERHNPASLRCFREPEFWPSGGCSANPCGT